MITSALKKLLLKNKKLEFCFWYCRTLDKRIFLPRIKVMSLEATIIDLVTTNKSIARYGDAEFNVVMKKANPNYQAHDELLSQRLLEVLQSDLDNFMVAIPGPFYSMKGERMPIKYFWYTYINKNGKELFAYFNKKKVYGNAGITRFYLGQSDKRVSYKIAKLLKQLWDKKDLLLIEGELSRMGVGNDLFDNANSIKRLLCPSKNAFNSYDAILEASIAHGKDKVILIALGPTASVLSYDLAKLGYKALDVGHIDVEYMWMLMKAERVMPIKGRYVSETRDEEDYEIPEPYNTIYQESIVGKVGL
ncbi:GT-D fold domain-containing glycosyltransferase [Flavobacterium chungnamense]|jgi:glycosyltransferase family protein